MLGWSGFTSECHLGSRSWERYRVSWNPLWPWNVADIFLILFFLKFDFFKRRPWAPLRLSQLYHAVIKDSVAPFKSMLGNSDFFNFSRAMSPFQVLHCSVLKVFQDFQWLLAEQEPGCVVLIQTPGLSVFHGWAAYKGKNVTQAKEEPPGEHGISVLLLQSFLPYLSLIYLFLCLGLDQKQTSLLSKGS